MKNIILIAITLTFCNQKNQNFNEKLISSFCTEVILNDEVTFLDTIEYIEFSPEFINDRSKHAVVMSILKDLRVQLLKNHDYETLDHKTFLKNKKFETIKFSNEYKNSNTYHLLSNDSLITSFIVKDKKIISFSYNIIKTKNQVRTPLIL